MIIQQTGGKNIPGKGTQVDRGMEVGTQDALGSPGWLECGGGGHGARDPPGRQAGPGCEGLQHLTKEAELNSAAGSHGLHWFSASPLSTFGPGKLSVMQNTIAGGCAVHSRVFSSFSLVSSHKIGVVPAPCNGDNPKCLQALPNVL